MIPLSIKAVPEFVSSGACSAQPRSLAIRWYVAQTRAQHERRVSEQIHRMAMECFLPLYEKISQWKDRRVCLQVPLFPGYVFVRLDLRERLRILAVPGLVRLVGFAAEPAALSDQEIDEIRNGLKRKLRAEPCPYLPIGRRVRIDRGPLRGMEGILVRRKNGFRLVLSVALIQRSIAVEVDGADVCRTPV
jgi:transcription antitermination factor NusG